MKTIGLIGGMSWESTQAYYRIANEEVRQRLGDNHSARIVLHSVDYDEVKRLETEGKWDELREMMVKIAEGLKASGADFIVICTNTMHIVADAIRDRVGMEVLHIADITAKRIADTGLNRVALLGTRYTMESTFYPELLQEKFGIETIIPTGNDSRIVHGIIYNELVRGEFKDDSRKVLKGVVDRLKQQGAQGVILGCSEIPLLFQQKDSPLPVFDTTTLHAKAAVDYALQ